MIEMSIYSAKMTPTDRSFLQNWKPIHTLSLCERDKRHEGSGNSSRYRKGALAGWKVCCFSCNEHVARTDTEWEEIDKHDSAPLIRPPLSTDTNLTKELLNKLTSTRTSYITDTCLQENLITYVSALKLLLCYYPISTFLKTNVYHELYEENNYRLLESKYKCDKLSPPYQEVWLADKNTW